MLYFRWIIFLGLTILSIFGILPTYDYYTNYFGNDNHKNKIIIQDLKDKSLTLGLDLQGGIHMVLELDLVDLFLNLINDEYKNDFEDLEKFEKSLINISENSTSLTFIDNLFEKYDSESLINYYSDFIPESTEVEDELNLLKSIFKEKLFTKLLSSTEIIRNRIDAMGVTEPIIQTKGNNQIVIEIAGIQDTSRAEALIKNTGKLEFVVVKDNSRAWNKILNKKSPLNEIVEYLYLYDGVSLTNFSLDLTDRIFPYMFVKNENKAKVKKGVIFLYQ